MHKIIDIDFGSTRYEELVELRYKVLLEPLGLKFLDSHRDKEINYLHVGCIDNLDNTLIGGMMLIPLSNDTIRMMQVAVADKHQDSGVGRELVAHAEKRAEQIVISVISRAEHIYSHGQSRDRGTGHSQA